MTAALAVMAASTVIIASSWARHGYRGALRSCLTVLVIGLVVVTALGRTWAVILLGVLVLVVCFALAVLR